MLGRNGLVVKSVESVLQAGRESYGVGKIRERGIGLEPGVKEREGELGPHLTQCGQGRGLPACQFSC